MLKDCWPSLRSSWQNATFDSVLRRWALIYLPTVCVVSIFVALTWLGLSMNNGTFRDKDLVVVITYFAALLVLECILLAHVAIRRQRTTRLSPKLLCVDAATTQTMSSATNANVARPKPATSTAENLDQAQYQPRPQVLHALPTQVTAERPREPVPHTEQPTPSASSSPPTGSLPSQRVPALCEPVNSSPARETNRLLTATTTTYIPERSLPVLPPTPDDLSSWNPTMANSHQSRLAVSPPSSPPPRPALLQAEAPMKPSSVASPAPAPTVQPERRATPRIPDIKPLKIHTQISAVPSTAPPARKSRPMYRATGTVEEHERQQPQPQPHSPGTPQVQSQVQPQSRSHSGLLQKNLIALAGT